MAHRGATINSQKLMLSVSRKAGREGKAMIRRLLSFLMAMLMVSQLVLPAAGETSAVNRGETIGSTGPGYPIGGSE